jgi:hypothetical protein
VVITPNHYTDKLPDDYTATVEICCGMENGKEKKDVDVISSGKYLGKKNETNIL